MPARIRSYRPVAAAAVAFAALVLVAPARATNHQSKEAADAYMGVMSKMHEDMTAKPMSGDPDRDFAMMMIPHHQGAVDAAKVELQYGKDEELRKMAQKVVDAQQKEIAELQKWLKEHPDQ